MDKTIEVPLRDSYALLISLLHTQHTLKQWRCSCGNLDSMRGCGSIWGKWSCVFKGIEMDKFPSGRGRG